MSRAVLAGSRGPVGIWGPSGRWSRGTTEQTSSEGSLPAGMPGKQQPRRWLILLGLLAALLALGAWLFIHRPQPSLDELALAGPRGPVCERVIVLVDDSGSMQSMASARDRALKVILPWLQRNLRTGDEIAVDDFAATAAGRLPVTAVDQMSGSQLPAAPAVEQGDWTYVRPALARVHKMAATSCDVDIVLVSDGQFADLPSDAAQGRSLLLGAGIHDLELLVPGKGSEDPPPEWRTGFPDLRVTHFDGRDPKQTSVAIARAVAAFTGQTLTWEK